MTSNEFSLTMIGQGHETVGTGRDQTRLRYLVAEAFTERAKELRADGRRDKAGVCLYIARMLESGSYPSKKVSRKAGVDIAIVRDRLVDGVSLSGH